MRQGAAGQGGLPIPASGLAGCYRSQRTESEHVQAVHAAQSRSRRIGAEGMTSAEGPYKVATVADLDDDALLCHAYGHAWDQEPIEETVPGWGGTPVWQIEVRCSSCGKRRIDLCEPDTYELLTRRYIEPPGYRVAEPATRVTYRAEVVARRGRLTRKRVRTVIRR
jgi:hypothetical protein